MNFKDKLKKVMHDLNINQKQLSGMTGICKSSISQYLSGKNVPTEERQKSIAASLGLEADYFCDCETDAALLVSMAARRKKVSRLLVEDAAKLLGMGTQTVRDGLQQGVFPWGYAIKTDENRWVYFINATKFAEIEKINIKC